MRNFQSEPLEERSGGQSQMQAPAPALQGADIGQSSSLSATQLTKIFAAFMASILIALFFTFLSSNSDVGILASMQPIIGQTSQVFFIAAALAMGIVLLIGIPLAIVAWCTTPRVRFLLALPFLSVVLPMLALMVGADRFSALGMLLLGMDIVLALRVWQVTPKPRVSMRLLLPFLAVWLLLVAGTLMSALSFIAGSVPFVDSLNNLLNAILFYYPILIVGNLANVIALLFVFGVPVICTLAISHAIRQAAISDKWLRRAQVPARLVTLALVVMALALISWGFYLALFAPALFFSFLVVLPPYNSWLLLGGGMLVAAFAAVRAFSDSRSRTR